MEIGGGPGAVPATSADLVTWAGAFAWASFSKKCEKPAPACVSRGGPERHVCGRQRHDSAAGRNDLATARPSLKAAAARRGHPLRRA